jgi:hypothetical protein
VAACTEHGNDKFNTVHFLYNYSISKVLNTKLTDNVYLFLKHLLAIFMEFVVLVYAFYTSIYLVTVCIYD